MNKYFLLVIVAVVILALGIGYKVFLRPQSSAPVDTGRVKAFTVTTEKDQWSFAPDTIEVERGDHVVLTVVNQDSYDHGIAIDAFGISQRMPAHQTIMVEFTATQAGEFPFYCSVPCGEGVVHGVKRGHFDMVGRIKVKDLGPSN